MIKNNINYRLMSTKSIWSDVLGKIECNYFEERLEELSALTGGSNRIFLNSRHKCRFYWLLREFKIENKDLLVVLYLMSSDSYLFWILQDMVEDDSIEFDSFDLNPEHRYLILFQLMRDISMGQEIIYYYLLADKKFINDDNFIVIANALAIRKIGLEAIHYI